MTSKNITSKSSGFKINIKKYARRIEKLREEIVHINQIRDGTITVHIFAFNIDWILRDFFDEMAEQLPKIIRKKIKTSLAIVATGGYGRGELNLYSDIDLLFLINSEANKECFDFSSNAISLLWNLKTDIGHAVRTVKQCLECIGLDLKSATALFNTKLLWGNKKLYDNLNKSVKQKIHKEGREWWIKERLEVIKNRHQKYGDTVYLMEPNIKEGEGGLRDIEFIKWTKEILKGTIKIKDIERRYLIKKDQVNLLSEAHNFLLRLRNEIHAIDKKRIDILSYEKQLKIAKKLKYRKTKHFLPEEKLMYEYYRHANFVDRLCKQSIRYLEYNLKYIFPGDFTIHPPEKISPCFQIVDGSLQIERKMHAEIKKSPSLLLKTFLISAERKAPLSEGTKELITSHLALIDDQFRSARENIKLFMQIFSTLPGLSLSLYEMHHTGFLNSFIPEFKRITGLVKVDFYHRYTTDEHSLISVKEFENLLNLNEHVNDQFDLVKVAKKIKRKDLLALAILLHDVGKGEGHGHVLRGAQIVRRITQNMGFSTYEQDIVRNLVMFHLRLAHISQRRDLDDPNIIKSVADEIGDIELLKMLYILTYCDLKAVAPDSWNDWKGNLLYELYHKTALYLEGKTIEETMSLSVPDDLDNKISDILIKQDKKFHFSDIVNFINSIPIKYLSSMNPENISCHYLMIKELNPSNKVVWKISHPKGVNYSELTVCAYDEPGFFYKVCAALSSKDINILGAQIFSTKDGYCIDIFQVTNLNGDALPEDFSLERTRQTLNSVIKNEAPISVFTEKYIRHRSKKYFESRHQQIPTKIIFDNKTSHSHTIIEVKTTDRPWLLYKITSTLANQSLNIDLSLITTEAYRVVDVFYVTDLDSNKITDKTQLLKIEKDLLLALKES